MTTDDKTATSVDLCASLKGEGLEEVCACCGIAAVDDITLKFCDGCDLVKYCSNDCRENQREQHEKDCKTRKTELQDKQLFTQSDSSYKGECPICCLPLPLRPSESILMTCCCKTICMGCKYANVKREIEQGLEQRCVYCRESALSSQEERNKQVMKRVKKNDPVAMTEMGKKHHQKGEYYKALQYYKKAAELGHVEAHFCLGGVVLRGERC